MRRVARVALLCVAFLFVALPVPSWAQEQERRYFEETRHIVSGEFLAFYNERGGLPVFGYPVTREFEENGRMVQYFQRVRMEKHPENPDPYKVQLGLLGDQLGYRQGAIPEQEIPLPGHPDKKYFGETGHTIAFAFLDFYMNNGGLDIFGYPITEWVIEPNGRIVQYFQRGKMEWYPENPPGQRVQLGMLGTIYVEQFVDPIYTEPESYDPIVGEPPSATPTPFFDPSVAASNIQDIYVTVTLKHPIIGLDGVQTVYVYVRDQDSHGVPDVEIEMTVEYQDGRRDRFVLDPTNANGYTQFDFEIDSPAPGYVVIVDLMAQYQDIEAQTSTAFLPWW